MEVGDPTFIKISDNRIHVNFLAKNTSSSPALNLSTQIGVVGMPPTTAKNTYDCLFCMPGEASPFEADITGEDAGKFYDFLMAGGAIFQIKITYSDVFKQEYVLIEEGKFVDNKLIPTHFEIQGLPTK